MPNTRRIEPPFVKLRRLLLGYEIRPVELSKILGCAYGTAKSRLDNPSSFTIAELDIISRKAHIPFDEIREAIIH